ncbi:MAG TPA: SRPBCC domain-containing protein [Steroidobacteraceae bacterium]|nr:SRPBCC domain-containing protein [Steroidobacteraceae bacterium]
MNAATHPSLAPAAVVVRRTIAAPADDLFDAWLDPEALAEWMRPGTIQRSEARTDPRVGGEYEVIMYGEKGPISHRGVYKLIDRPRRLVFTWASPLAGAETLVTVDFRAIDRRTEVIVTHEQLPAAEIASHTRGWTSGLQHLDEACQAGKI